MIHEQNVFPGPRCVFNRQREYAGATNSNSNFPEHTSWKVGLYR